MHHLRLRKTEHLTGFIDVLEQKTFNLKISLSHTHSLLLSLYRSLSHTQKGEGEAKLTQLANTTPLLYTDSLAFYTTQFKMCIFSTKQNISGMKVFFCHNKKIRKHSDSRKKVPSVWLMGKGGKF